MVLAYVCMCWKTSLVLSESELTMGTSGTYKLQMFRVVKIYVSTGNFV